MSAPVDTCVGVEAYDNALITFNCFGGYAWRPRRRLLTLARELDSRPLIAADERPSPPAQTQVALELKGNQGIARADLPHCRPALRGVMQYAGATDTSQRCAGT